MNKAVFLDRDGVINAEVGNYIMRMDDFVVHPFAIRHIKLLHKNGYKIIVITNQGGIAKGLYSHQALAEMHALLLHLAEGCIDEIFYCPHHPDYSQCLCRKPDSIMIEKALAKYNIDASQSIFIGDKQRDMDAAAKAGVKGFLIDENQDWGFIAEQLIR